MAAISRRLRRLQLLLELTTLRLQSYCNLSISKNDSVLLNMDPNLFPQSYPSHLVPAKRDHVYRQNTNGSIQIRSKTVITTVFQEIHLSLHFFVV